MKQAADDVTRYKFTAWIKIVAKRAKIDYLRKLDKQPKEQSIYDDNVSCHLIYEEQFIKNSDFEFENKDLSRVFLKLPRKRKQILILLFVENMTPEEIAQEQGCSVQHVYNLRSLALNELKNKLKKD